MIRRLLVPMLIHLALAGAAYGQALPDSLVQRIRAGALRIVVPGDSVVLALVGAPGVPLVDATINGRGPYRLLVDLGSNVTLLRRNVVDASGSKVLVDRTSSDIVRAETIGLGEARLEEVTLASYDELDVDGVLGYNVLQYSSFTLDFPGRRLVLHHRSLPPPDGVSVSAYTLQGRMPYVMVSIGADSLSVNLNTGASEWMTISPQLQPRLRWVAPPAPGRTVSNNQTGRTRVLEGHLADTLRFAGFEAASPLVYVNQDAEDAWLGAEAMSGASWTLDPRRLRVQVTGRRLDRAPVR
jgi:hypothetical protein